MAKRSPTFYEALSHPPVRAAGNDVDLNIYRNPGETRYGVFRYEAPVKGRVLVDEESGATEWRSDFEIAYTKVGDRMMPAAQTQRFANVLGTDDVEINYIPNAGHFGHTDRPKYVADTLVNFFRRVVGRRGLADVNLGNEGIWKGDEREMIQDLRTIFAIDSQSRL